MIYLYLKLDNDWYGYDGMKYVKLPLYRVVEEGLDKC